MSSLLPRVRIIGFAVLILLSLGSIAINAHILSALYSGFYAFTPSFAGMSIAVSVLTILSLPAMLLLDRTRKNVITSKIIFEIGWLGFLWTLWVAASALAVKATSFDATTVGLGLSGLPDGNTLIAAACAATETAAEFSSSDSLTAADLKPGKPVLCKEIPVIEAFAFINWIFLLGYVLTLVVFSIASANRGNAVWTSSVNEADFSRSPTNNKPRSYNMSSQAPVGVQHPQPPV